jgi:hypothetical protein
VDADERLAVGKRLFQRIENGLRTPVSAGWLTRFVILRALALMQAVAFAIALVQAPALVGPGGLLPATRFFAMADRVLGAHRAALRLPSLFHVVAPTDTALRGVSAAGLLLSIAVLLGVTNALVQLAIWALYLSLVYVGQTFWGYGWESLLVEATFLSVFLAPLRGFRPFASRLPPHPVVIIAFRWLAVRVMLGAGLIKLRGDPCWRDLTCLVFHYETQPNPHPLSWLWHKAPPWFHAGGVLTNHAVECVAPLFAFGPRRARLAAGVAFVAFQTMLVLSGNLSFLNWLTIAVCLACFDDAALGPLFPRRVREHVQALSRTAVVSRAHRWTVGALSLGIAVLSVGPTVNLLSPAQAMNTSFEPLMLVNTYGAFGSVSRERFEIVIEGAAGEGDQAPEDDAAWRAYELPCKPGAVTRAPCLITPYHLRLDWQMWFAAMSRADSEPWFVNLVRKLLEGEPRILGLFAENPFPDRPPRWIRARYYRYRFTTWAERDQGWWKRTDEGMYLRPMTRDDPLMQRYLSRAGLFP